jgi:iron(III) transport system ATP-binding protein
MTAVTVDTLVVAYGGVRAVDAVSFTVEPGEHLTLLGPSGCGKTTTLRAVAGLERPASGRIAIAGKTVFDGATRIDAPPEARGLSMVFQSYAIWPHMTVAENVAFPLRARGVSRAETRAAVARALALVDLAGFADRPATRLSGGQQQRVALARAVAFGTDTVLFDEPLSNLDAQLRVQMRTELAELQRQLGFAAIYVTHDQDEAFALSHRILLMRAGRIEQQGTPADLYATPATRFAASFMGVRNILDAELRGGEARLADGSIVRAAGADGPCALAFRPGAVVLGTGQHATIRHVAFAGDLVQVFLRSGPIEICAHARPGPELQPGAEIQWHVPPGACLVLKE